MSDDFKREEKVEKREEPGRVGSTLIKYGFITLIIIIVLFFIANYLLPLLPGNEEGGSSQNESGIEIEINEDLNGDDENGNGEDNGE